MVTKAVTAAFDDVAAIVATPSPAAAPSSTRQHLRTTLRLPDHLKVRVEEAAARDGISVNAWLVRAVTGASNRPVRAPRRREIRGGERFTGWVR